MKKVIFVILSMVALGAYGQSQIDSLNTKHDLCHTWEVGVVFGTSNYSGTLTPKFLDPKQFQFSGGIYGQYNINNYLSVRIDAQYARISGSDISQSDYTRRKRANNFRNDIGEGTATLHFHFLKYGSGIGKIFSPTIFAGVGLLHHNPQARIFTGLDSKTGEATYLTINDDGTFANRSDKDGRNKMVWVPLRSIGTEGQTVNQNNKTYSPWQVSFPMGIELNFIIKQSFVIGLNAGVHFTLTQYLDDVGGYYYDRANNMQAIADANAGNIKGKVKGKTITVPDLITVNDINSNPVQISTAALLANPSLINTIVREQQTGQVLNNNANNDAYTYANATKSASGKDWYAFIGVTVTKIFGGKNKSSKTHPSPSLESRAVSF